MKIKLGGLRLLIFLPYSALILIGCTATNKPNLSASKVPQYRTSGAVVKYSELSPVSQGAAEKGHPAPVMGVQHYFGEEHGGIHGGPHGEPTQ